MTGRCATCLWAHRVDDSLRCERDTEGDALMVVEGGRLFVAPDFGCVQWEAREVSQT